MSLIVQKFGGSSLATPDQIKSVAKKIAELYKNGNSLIVVTSAMGKTTDQLTQLARQVSARPQRREFDMLLTTGERVSMALMAIALNDLGCPAVSFTGSQAGIMTDGVFCNAQITELKPMRVAAALEEKKVVALAGFQGVDPVTKEITTLGRGGSDTTAVAMAAHFKADRCDILKDVDGVYDIDPQVSHEAKLLPQISIDVLYEFCFWGAKVLNYRAVEWARKTCVPLFVGRSDSFVIGTEIILDRKLDNAVKTQERRPFGINSHKSVFQISISGFDLQECKNTIEQVFLNKDLAFPQVLFQKFEKGVGQFTFVGDDEQNGNYKDAIASCGRGKWLRDSISTVTITYSDGQSDTQIVPALERVKTIRNIFQTMRQ